MAWKESDSAMIAVSLSNSPQNTASCLLIIGVHSGLIQTESNIKILLFLFLIWKQVLLGLQLLLRLLALLIWQTLK